MIDNQSDVDPELIRAKINSETARIPWSNLQRFFASGKTLLVKDSLDLIDVAYAFHSDDTETVEQWVKSDKICAVSTDQARHWVAKDSLVWAVVVKPWVLIQSREN